MRLERRVLEREGFMQYFEKQGNALIFRQDGETVRVEPWQKDSLRVRGTLLSEIEEGSIALLDPETVEAEIELVDELKATIKNGKIQAVLEVQPWGQKLRITFLNQKGEVLLSEIANGGALCLRAHDYRALKGGAYQLKVSFDSNPDEKIYGMGQYQQERMNLKGCNLELAHRNSQASIPFYVSSLGYGFLWHNAAVGEVHFGTNTTEWLARTTKQLDYWVTAGDTPAEIEEHFADAIGKVPMMPEYGLGFWQCKLRHIGLHQIDLVGRHEDLDALQTRAATPFARLRDPFTDRWTGRFRHFFFHVTGNIDGFISGNNTGFVSGYATVIVTGNNDTRSRLTPPSSISDESSIILDDANASCLQRLLRERPHRRPRAGAAGGARAVARSAGGGVRGQPVDDLAD